MGKSLLRSVSASLLLLLVASQAKAHSHHTSADFDEDYLNELRLVDYGDGQQMWKTRLELMQRSEFVHAEGRCGGYFDVTGQSSVDKTQLESVSTFLLDLPRRPITQQAQVEGSMSLLHAQGLQDWVVQLSNFRNRYYRSHHGVDAAQFIAHQFEALARGRSDVTVELIEHRFEQPSVIATIQGRSLSSEVVVLGGHLDSVNQSGWGSRNMHAPGADDNASGIATLLEVFRALMESDFVPERTIQFMGYAGEEAGLLGSQDIANRYRRENRTVVAVIQFDMTAFPGSGQQMTFITDHVNPDLTQFAQRLARTYVRVPITEDRCGYACSDHASWTRVGYPSVMPSEAMKNQMNRALHTTRDTVALLDFALGLHFAKLGVAFAVELSVR